eukprot:6462926-Amphidinium_carterae.1
MSLLQDGPRMLLPDGVRHGSKICTHAASKPAMSAHSPKEGVQHSSVTRCSNKKAVQWDTNIPDIVQ